MYKNGGLLFLRKNPILVVVVVVAAAAVSGVVVDEGNRVEGGRWREKERKEFIENDTFNKLPLSRNNTNLSVVVFHFKCLIFTTLLHFLFF